MPCLQYNAQRLQQAKGSMQRGHALAENMRKARRHSAAKRISHSRLKVRRGAGGRSPGV